jgi:hypothetical protein
MPAARARGYRERYRYHHGCERPKTALARIDRVIESEADERARIAAALEEANRKAAEAVAQLEARTREAALEKARLEFMLNDKGHYVGDRLPEMLKRYPMPPEAVANVPGKRGRGRPRKDGSPAQPRSEAERAASSERRASGKRAANKRGRSAASRQRVPASVVPEVTSRDAAVSDVVDRVDMVLPGASTAASVPDPVSVAPDSEIVLPAAEADLGSLAEPDLDLEPVAEPEPLPLPPPVPLAAMGQEVGFVLGDTDALTAEVEVSSFVDKVVDLFSPEVEQERLRRADPARLPKGYDPTWADHWQEDPNAHLPEMYAEFITFGTAIDKAPEDLTDEEARLLLGPVLFGLPYDYHKNPAKYEGVKLPPVFTREKDVPGLLWQGEIARAGGSIQQIAVKYKDNVDLWREVERARRRMWPFALRRRDVIKDLMTAVAVGEMSFAPASSAQADLDRSVQWWVFRHADHDWLVTSGREDWKIYAWRMLDKLPWPAGLSRIELLERFGAGMKPTDVPNLSSQGQPPKWLVPDHKWIYSPDYKLLTVHGEPLDLGYTPSVRGGDLVASPDLPMRVPVRRREIGKKPRG